MCAETGIGEATERKKDETLPPGGDVLVLQISSMMDFYFILNLNSMPCSCKFYFLFVLILLLFALVNEHALHLLSELLLDS